MPTLKHRVTPHASNHVVHSLSYANEAARLADATLTTDDVGRDARDEDTGFFHRMIGGPPASWARVAAPLDTDAIANLSGVAGATTTQALDALGAVGTDNTAAIVTVIADTEAAIALARSYAWVWANAAARTAQAVTAADVGARGYQTDIARAYELLQAAPNRWGQLPDARMTAIRGVYAIANSTSLIMVGLHFGPWLGTVAAKALGTATRTLAMHRTSYVTVATAQGCVAWRNSNSPPTPGAQGWRYTWRFALAAVSGAERWWVGLTTFAVANNADALSLPSCIVVGRQSTDANVQLFHNDAAGNATKVDLGAAFPANVADTGYELQIWTANGTSYGWQLVHVDTGAVTSGVLTTEIPAASALLLAVFFCTNNTDAQVVGIDIGDLLFQQLAPT